MTVVLMKQTAIGKRAYAISRADADALVADGKAIQDKVHTGIYEEVTAEEMVQGYMTRNMLPLPDMMPKRKPGRPPKVRLEETETEPVADEG
jgi:hypothetical protein